MTMLERLVQQPDGSKRWWTWWHRSLPRWLQTKTNELWKLLTRPLINHGRVAFVQSFPPLASEEGKGRRRA